MLEKLKLNSILGSITTETMYGSQMFYCHFTGKKHNFNTHAKFILIEQIQHINIEKKRLKQGENFLILTLELVMPKCLNQELN